MPCSTHLKAILAACLLSAALSAQPTSQIPEGAVFNRSYPPTPSVSAFRPEGELRVWTFFSKQTTFGSLSSRTASHEAVEGLPAVALEQELQIDFAKIGQDRKVYSLGSTLIAENGTYLGSEYQIGEGDTSEQLQLSRQEGDRIAGYFTRSGQKNAVDTRVPAGQAVWDQYFVDQLELLLALRPLKVGDTISEDLFSPQSVLSYRLRGEVKWFEWKQIYKGRWDSVLYVQFTLPQRYDAFLTPDKRLVRLDLEDLDIRVYQDAVRAPGGGPRSPAGQGTGMSRLSPRVLLLHMPHFVAYLLIGYLSALFLSQGGFKQLVVYLALSAGAIAYLFMPFVQVPLQRFVIERLMAPQVSQGGSIYVWALLPALIAAIIQELAKLGMLFSFAKWRRTTDGRLPMLGAFLGAGFGAIEAAYLLGTSIHPLFDWLLAERLFGILLHTSLGALLGCALGNRGKRLGTLVPATILVNAAVRYLPVFVQQHTIEVGFMHFVLAFMALGVVVGTLVILHNSQPDRQPLGRGD